MAGVEASIATAVRITGRVQGVWFRGWVCDEARRLGLTGSVRNAPDGSVVALFVGPGTAVAAMLALCREGPPMRGCMRSRPRRSPRFRNWRSSGSSGEAR